MKKLLAIFVSLLLLAGLANSVVMAQDLPTIEIPINTVVWKPAGTQVPLVSKDVPEEYIGYVCTANAVAKNQGSVHPDNNLVVSSDGTSITMYDVERAGGVTTPASGALELGPTIDVTLSMGKDGVFSGGMTVQFECEEPQEPVYECTSLTAVVDTNNDKKYNFTTKTETSDDVTVEKYVYDFGITGESVVTTDQTTISKVYSEAGTYDVSVEVHFNVNEQGATDTCTTQVVIDEEPVTPPPEQPKVLPNTGPVSILTGLFGTGALGYGAVSLRSSRKALKNSILSRDE